jgi:hypothetical protein
MRLQQCPCGSGQFPDAQYDARAIFLCYTCSKCEREKLKGYRPDVLSDPNYWADEAIEPDGDDLGPDPLGDWHGRNE